MRRAFSRLRSNERGTAVVEFALVAMPLFLVIFGILDFGRALNYYNDVTQLAGQGARAAAVNQDPNGGPAAPDFQQQLADRADSPELTGSNPLSICISQMPTTAGDPVTVTATYTFHFIHLVSHATLTLHSSQTERFEATSPTYNGGCSGP